jgi:hypothetical protein
VVKSSLYRDEPEEFSNTYCFQGSPPGDDASWTVLLNDVLAKERKIYQGDVSYVRAYGYDNNDPKKAHVFAHDWTVPGPPPTGSYVATGAQRMAGDQAGLVWWLLNRKTDKGKPSYLRKYIHRGYIHTTDPDKIDAGWTSALAEFASTAGIQAVHGGLMSPGGEKDTDPNPGGAVVNDGVSPWVTTRTLKRRGKRPKTGN